MFDTPEDRQDSSATFAGTDDNKILLLAQMDTVYPRGMLARQPYRTEGDRAYVS